MADAEMQNTNTVGRPTKFTPELGLSICSHLSEGMSLRTVCGLDGMPDKSTVFRWLSPSNKTPELIDFRDQYARAKQEAADAMAEDLIDIADDGTNDWIEMYDKEGNQIGWKLNQEHVQRSKLRVDTRKWLMAKMKPKKYGDKLDLTTDGEKLPTPIYGGQSVKSVEKPN